jgi:alpha-ribazole phosphatase
MPLKMPDTIYLIRHAEPASDGIRRYLGQSDPDLSAEGIKQANSLAQIMQKHQLSAVYSSDLKRTLHTAEPIAGKFNLTVKTDIRLREIHMGNWDNLAFEEVKLKFMDEYEKRSKDMVNYRPEGGESFSDVSERAWAAFNEIISGSSGNITIVSHAGAIRTIICRIMEIPLKDLFSIRIDYADIRTIIKKGDKLVIE